MTTIRNFLTQNKGKLYAALPSQMEGGKVKSPRHIIADKLNVSDTTVYIILTGRLDKTHASDATMEAILAEAMILLQSTKAFLEEYELFKSAKKTELSDADGRIDETNVSMMLMAV